MRELAILTFQTLDGVMQAPAESWEDTSGRFNFGGWARSFWEPVMAQVRKEAMSAPYDLLLGRRTYDNFAKVHNNTDTSAPETPMDAATKYVVTRSPESLNWQNSIGISGDIADEIRKLKALDGQLLQVHGSWQLIQFLLMEGLVDELRIWTFPVTLGKGKRLFNNEMANMNLRLIKTAPTGNGPIMCIYRTD